MKYRILSAIVLLSSIVLVPVCNAQIRSGAIASRLPSFQQIPGALAQISVGCGIWGVNQSGEIFFYDDVTHAWDRADQSGTVFIQVAAGSSSSVNDAWALDASHVAYSHVVRNSSDGSRSTSSWDALEWPHLVQIEADLNNVWGLDESGRIYRYLKNNPIRDTPSLIQIPGTLVQIASLGGNFQVQTWGLDSSHRIYKFHELVGGGGTFELVPGALIQIAVGQWVRPTEVWGINEAHQIYRFNEKTSSFEQVPGSLARIAVGIDGVWGLNDSDEIYQFKEESNSFARVPGNLRQIALAPGCDDGIWGINSKNEIYRMGVATDAMQLRH
jgi:hypothetical protein